MGSASNTTCQRSIKKIFNKSESCNVWKYPPFPEPLLSKDAKNELLGMVWQDEGFLLYAKECPVDIERPSTTTTSTANAATISVVVLLVIFTIAAVAVVLWWYLWKKKKMRSRSIKSLPLKEYSNKNFLDNNARQNHSYSQSESSHPDDMTPSPVIGNQYGSLPPSDGKVNAAYVKTTKGKFQEERIEATAEIYRINISGQSEMLSENGYKNDNFVNGYDAGERSPGVSSQTPLFEDMVDGPGLIPNSVPYGTRLSDNSIHSTGKPAQNGSFKKVPSGRLPPIDTSLNKSDIHKNSDPTGENSDSVCKTSDITQKTSNSILRSPKKKKCVYLQRKSEPVECLNDHTQDMAENRNSV